MVVVLLDLVYGGSAGYEIWVEDMSWSWSLARRSDLIWSISNKHRMSTSRKRRNSDLDLTHPLAPWRSTPSSILRPRTLSASLSHPLLLPSPSDPISLYHPLLFFDSRDPLARLVVVVRRRSLSLNRRAISSAELSRIRSSTSLALGSHGPVRARRSTKVNVIVDPIGPIVPLCSWLVRSLSWRGRSIPLLLPPDLSCLASLAAASWSYLLGCTLRWTAPGGVASILLSRRSRFSFASSIVISSCLTLPVSPTFAIIA